VGTGCNVISIVAGCWYFHKKKNEIQKQNKTLEINLSAIITENKETRFFKV
jgi:hypothetical protein